jgi:inhibitor of cysteine peptidase
MSMKRLGIADNGAHIDARSVEGIVLELPENPTTGYRWHIEEIEGSIELVEDAFNLPSDATFGGGGTREFTFRRRAPGVARLKLKHWQEWEGERSVDKRFSAEIEFTD